MKVQMQGSLTENGRRVYLGITAAGNLREFTLLPDTAAEIVVEVEAAAKKKRTIELDATEIDEIRRPGL